MIWPSIQFVCFFIMGLLLIAGCASMVEPTPPQTQPAPGSTPIAAADGIVTFKAYLPSARSIGVSGDFGSGEIPMQGNGAGVWSLTVGPLRPDLYSYNFIVDGAENVDPNNNTPKVGVIWFSSQFLVPGKAADFFAVENVPHGEVHEILYYSPAFGQTRRVIVYTPPGYERNPNWAYPVLYLLHGYGDDETAWTSGGKANLILDNLLAEGRARPMVIVMPFGSPSREWLVERGRPDEAHGKRVGVEAFAEPQIERELMEQVMPLIESRFHVGSSGQLRAIAGLSMGGYQALTIGLHHPDQFAYIAGFSAALIGDNKATFSPMLADSAGLNRKLRLLWMGIGDQDHLLKGDEELEQMLSAAGVRHEWVVTPGYAHAWTLWRVYLRDLLPRLFGEGTGG